MKIVILLVLVAFTSAEEWKLKTYDEWLEIHKECDYQFNVPAELVEKARDGKYIPKEVFQVMLCVLRESGVWSDTEGFPVERLMFLLKKVAKKNNVTEIFLKESLESCVDKNTEGSSPFDWAYRCLKCFMDNEKFYAVLDQVHLYETDD